MRVFSPKEKELLSKFVFHRKNEDIPNLEVTKYIKTELETFALKWQSKPQKIIQFFSLEENKDNPEKANPNYFKICDFVYFLMELEKYGFIKFQRPISLEDKDDDTILLYDKDKFEYNSNGNSFLRIHQKDIILPIGNNTWTMKSLVEIKTLSNFYFDFLYDLVRVGNSIIYPLPRLIDYVENDFKTLEQRQFNEELQTAKETLAETKNTLKVTRRAFIVTLITLFTTIGIGVWQKLSQQEIDDKQLKSITTAIKEHKTITIDSVKALPADTFNVNVIQPKAKPTPKPQQAPLK